MAGIKAYITEALAPVQGEENALDALENSVDALRELSENISEAEVLSSRLDAALIEIRDIASAIENLDLDYNVDPGRLDEIESRQDILS
jgi:DNA repair protein RecN (Recombination protein N)